MMNNYITNFIVEFSLQSNMIE